MRRDVAGGVGDGQTRPDASAPPTDESQRERSTQGGAIVGGCDVPYRATGLGRIDHLGAFLEGSIGDRQECNQLLALGHEHGGSHQRAFADEVGLAHRDHLAKPDIRGDHGAVGFLTDMM